MVTLKGSHLVTTSCQADPPSQRLKPQFSTPAFNSEKARDNRQHMITPGSLISIASHYLKVNYVLLLQSATSKSL